MLNDFLMTLLFFRRVARIVFTLIENFSTGGAEILPKRKLVVGVVLWHIIKIRFMIILF